jgi:hypothetical protein
MNPTEPDFLKGIAQYGVLGLVTFLLGKRFLATSDEDRKWIREHGERAVLQNEQIVNALKDVVGVMKSFGETLNQVVETNKQVVETNARLVAQMTERKG